MPWQVLSIGETVEEVNDSGFLGPTPTLRCQLLADDSILQVTPLLHPSPRLSSSHPLQLTHGLASACCQIQVVSGILRKPSSATLMWRKPSSATLMSCQFHFRVAAEGPYVRQKSKPKDLQT